MSHRLALDTVAYCQLASSLAVPHCGASTTNQGIYINPSPPGAVGPRQSPMPAVTFSEEVVLDVAVHGPGLDLVSAPVWFYDTRFCSNVWGNRAALAFFGLDEKAFKAPQLERLAHATPSVLQQWKETNERLREDVEVKGKQVSFQVIGTEAVVPGCPGAQTSKQYTHLLFSPVTVLVSGTPRRMSMAQIPQGNSDHNHQRMVEMCNNHPMFQFLFDDNGKLLVANQRAMQNMKEHLGSCENYNLQMYLSMGECDGSIGPDDMYQEAMRAIFIEDKPCHRFAQLRWSKRHMGKFRWVLYEMWPLADPVSHKRAVLVCEQNISQVKALEDQFKRQNKRLEAQLEEALAQRDPAHKPAIDIDTPADKTLKLLDKLMRGLEVSPREAMELRDTILHAGADLRQPLNLSEQLMRNNQSVLDNEVSQSLIQLLSSRRPLKQQAEEKGSMLARSGKSMRDLSGGVVGFEEGTEEEGMDEAHAVLVMAKEMPDELLAVLARVDDWQFDAFKLEEVTGGRPLSLLSFVLFKRCEIVDKWQLDEHKLAKFLVKIEDGYRQNPYHNRIHAADVLQSLHVLVVRGGLISYGYCDEVSTVACYMSAIIHDYEHRGVNNDFLIRMSDALAVLYNDRSPMENHHLAAAFQLVNTNEFNFMPKVSNKAREQLRKQVIEMVLATDMKQHFAIHSMFQTKMQLNGRPSGGSGSKSLRSSPHNTTGDDNGGSKIIDDDQKSLVLQVALKCADLGHLASPRIVHRKWVCYLEEEFFRQGDSEKANTLTVSPLMDRDKNGITKSQVGFFDIVALPLFQSFAQAFPEATPMLDAVKDNYQMWREESSLFSGPNSRSA